MSLPPRLRRWANNLALEGHQVYITLTRNRTAMVRIQTLSRRKTALRLHEHFVTAPPAVLRDLAGTILRRDNEAWRRVVAYSQTIRVPPDSLRPVPIQTRGMYINLERELAFVKRKFFSEDLEARITWGKRGNPQRKKRRSIRFGSWHEDERLIRIHPLLDQEWVSKDFIRYLIYHELCHAVAKPQQDARGRHRVHHADFKTLEARYPNLKEMERRGTEIFERLIRERK